MLRAFGVSSLQYWILRLNIDHTSVILYCVQVTLLFLRPNARSKLLAGENFGYSKNKIFRRFSLFRLSEFSLRGCPWAPRGFPKLVVLPFSASNHSKCPLKHKNRPCFSLESCLTTFLLEHAHKSKFRVFFMIINPTTFGFSFFIFFIFFFFAFPFSLLPIFLLQLLAFYQASSSPNTHTTEIKNCHGIPAKLQIYFIQILPPFFATQTMKEKNTHSTQ